jgi:hypothetical protein
VDEIAPASPAIVVVVDEDDLRERLDEELRRRFAPDFTVLAVASPDAETLLDDLADSGRDVAVVIAATDLPGTGSTGVEVLAGVRVRYRGDRRLLLV